MKIEKGGLTFTVLASLLSVLVTLLGVIVTMFATPRGQQYSFIFACVVGVAVLGVLATVYARQYLMDLREARHSLEVDDIVRGVVPTLVSFQAREDLLRVTADGDAELTWNFDLISDVNESVPVLTFPIFAEVAHDAEPWKAVVVNWIEVNNRKRDTRNSFVPMDRRFPSDGRPYIIEHGWLRVPVDLERGHASSHVSVQMRLIGIFKEVHSLESFYVDIPYLTRSLTVEINSADGPIGTAPRPSGAVIDALSAVMDVPDAAESARRTGEVRQRGDTLVWQGETPKLGYRYKIFFRLEV